MPLDFTKFVCHGSCQRGNGSDLKAQTSMTENPCPMILHNGMLHDTFPQLLKWLCNLPEIMYLNHESDTTISAHLDQNTDFDFNKHAAHH